MQLAVAKSGEACLLGGICAMGDRRDAVQVPVAVRCDRDQLLGELERLGAIGDAGEASEAACLQRVLDPIQGNWLAQVGLRVVHRVAHVPHLRDTQLRPHWRHSIGRSSDRLSTRHGIRSAVCVLRSGKPDRKSTRLNSSHEWISYAVFCFKKKKKMNVVTLRTPRTDFEAPPGVVVVSM